MNRKCKWRTAAAAVAAASGIGFSSGKAIAMFFTQMGWASWLGVFTASVLFGVFCGGTCILAHKTGAVSLSGACMRMVGVRFGRLMGVLHGLLAVLTGMLMLCMAGKLAALAFPVQHAQWLGMLSALGLALMLNMRGMRNFFGFGLIAVVVCVAFHIGLALDPREVRFYRRFETVAELEGSVSAALVSAVFYAALCASAAVSPVMCPVARMEHPAKLALKCCAGMLIMLITANAAMTRGGLRLLSQAMPTVVLSARWGTFGYYACILSMGLSAVSTLSACIGIMIRVNEKHDKIPC